MTKVNVLPVDVMQVTESKGAAESSSVDSGKKFTEVINREMVNKESGKEANSSQPPKEITRSAHNRDNSTHEKQSVSSTKDKSVDKPTSNSAETVEAKERTSADADQTVAADKPAENNNASAAAADKQEKEAAGDDSITTDKAEGLDDSTNQFLTLLNASEELLAEKNNATSQRNEPSKNKVTDTPVELPKIKALAGSEGDGEKVNGTDNKLAEHQLLKDVDGVIVSEALRNKLLKEQQATSPVESSSLQHQQIKNEVKGEQLKIDDTNVVADSDIPESERSTLEQATQPEMKSAVLTTEKSVQTQDKSTNSKAERSIIDEVNALSAAHADAESMAQANTETSVKSRMISEQLNQGQNSNSHHTRVINQATANVDNTNGDGGENTDANSEQQGKNIDTLINHEGTEKLKNEGLVNKNSFQQMLASASSASNAALDSVVNPSSLESLLSKVGDESVSNAQASQLSQLNKATPTLQTEVLSIYRKDFTDALKDKVMVMINQKLQQVDIQLDPPELGNVQVRVNLQGEQAAVSIVVQNQQAKDALEDNLSKLKDLLAQSGIDLGDANIEQQNKQADEDGGKGRGAGAGKDGAEEEVTVEHLAQMNKVSSTGVDYFA